MPAPIMRTSVIISGEISCVESKYCIVAPEKPHKIAPASVKTMPAALRDDNCISPPLLF